MVNSKGSEKDSKLLGIINRKVTRRDALATTGKAAIGVVAAAVMGGMLAQPVMAKPTIVAHINGGGTAEMQPPLPAGKTLWGAGATLYSDGSALGHFTCVDQHGDAPGFPGNINGQVTNWFIDGDGYTCLTAVGKVHGFPEGNPPGGHPQDVTFIVRIRQFGGAGVGFWTLEVGGFIFCYELLTSGQIVYNPA